MIARALRPDDVILWPPGNEQWWVTMSLPADPQDVVDGLWRLGAEQLTGLKPGEPRFLRAEDLPPETDFPLVGWTG